MSQKFYLVITWVDLGYHAEALFNNELAANQRCDQLNKAHRKQKISDLQRGCRYTEAEAIEWVGSHQIPYEVVPMELTA